MSSKQKQYKTFLDLLNAPEEKKRTVIAGIKRNIQKLLVRRTICEYAYFVEHHKSSGHQATMEVYHKNEKTGKAEVRYKRHIKAFSRVTLRAKGSLVTFADSYCSETDRFNATSGEMVAVYKIYQILLVADKNITKLTDDYIKKNPDFVYVESRQRVEYGFACPVSKKGLAEV